MATDKKATFNLSEYIYHCKADDWTPCYIGAAFSLPFPSQVVIWVQNRVNLWAALNAPQEGVSQLGITE